MKECWYCNTRQEKKLLCILTSIVSGIKRKQPRMFNPNGWTSRTRTSHINNRLMISEVHKEHANIHSITMNFHAFTYEVQKDKVIVTIRNLHRNFLLIPYPMRAKLALHCIPRALQYKDGAIKNRNWTMLHLILIVWALSHLFSIGIGKASTRNCYGYCALFFLPLLSAYNCQNSIIFRYTEHKDTHFD